MPMEAIVRASFQLLSASAFAVTAFGAMAMLLSMIGIYGVVSYLVSLRTRELGIRVALGATRGQILSTVIGPVLKLSLIGTSIAIPVALAVSRSIRSLVFDVSLVSPMVLVSAAVVIFLALSATCGPAIAATRIEPMTTLKQA